MHKKNKAKGKFKLERQEARTKAVRPGNLWAEDHILVPGVFNHASEEDPEPSKGSNWRSRNCTVPTNFNPSKTHPRNDILPSPYELGIKENQHHIPCIDS